MRLDQLPVDFSGKLTVDMTILQRFGGAVEDNAIPVAHVRHHLDGRPAPI